MSLSSGLNLHNCHSMVSLLNLASALQEDELRRTIEGMAALKLRCIAFAYRLVEKSEIPIGEEAWANWQTPENNLILLGIAGIKVSFSHQIKMPAFMPNIHIIDALRPIPSHMDCVRITYFVYPINSILFRSASGFCWTAENCFIENNSLNGVT